MGRARTSEQVSLREQHAIRRATAERTLKPNPLSDYGIDGFITEAREAAAAVVQPSLLEWLPNVKPHFIYLEE